MIAKLISSAKAAFTFPILIILLDIAVLFRVQYLRSMGIIEEVSAALHFLGGVALAAIFFNFWEKHPAIYSFKKKPALNLILSLGFVALIGVLWELLEFSSDFALPKFVTNDLGPAQTSLSDTIADLFWDLIGGIAVALAYFKSSLYKLLPERT